MAKGTDQRNHGPAISAAGSARAAVERALAELRRGAAVVLADETGEGAAALVMAAETAGESDDATALIAAMGTAPACIVPAGRAAALGLDAKGARAVAIRAAGDRALTLDTGFVLALAGVEGACPGRDAMVTTPADAVQDSAVELVKLARLLPAALVTRIAGDSAAIAAAHDVPRVTAGAIAEYRLLVDDGPVRLVTSAPVPLDGAENAEIFAFRPADGGKEHLAIVIGRPATDRPVLLRIHSECFTGDLLGSLRCDCGEQLRGAIRTIAAAGGGILLYLAQEGRGIGLVNKLRAYRLQDAGFDTIEANERLGFDADERVYRPAATMLRALGFDAVRLLTNNPAKVDGLASCGIAIAERVPHAFPANGHNERYLRTKAVRAGHLL